MTMHSDAQKSKTGESPSLSRRDFVGTTAITAGGIAALGATLSALLDDDLDQIPVLQQLLMPLCELEARANTLADQIRKATRDRFQISIEPETSPVGGGSLPGFELETRVVALRGPNTTQLAEQLRSAARPVIARLKDEALLLDPRTLIQDDPQALIEALENAS